MRSFVDAEGREWEVVAGRESWGQIFAIFLPRDGGEVRQTMLSASSYGAANAELDGLDEGDLRELLERASPKSFG